MFILMVSLWESIQKFVLYWQVYLIKDLRNLDIFIWDVEIVLQNIRTHWYDNTSLNNVDLTCKLTTLLALTITSRASMIQHLNAEFMANDKDRYIFYFSKLHKSWRKGQVPPTITYFSFGEDKALHVVETLNEYINRSKPWRESNHEKQLLLSSIRPHNAVVSCTISGWLTKTLTLKQAEINTDLFKAHSRRSASSSKASVGGAPLVEILKRGSWSHHFTWQRFYNKHIIEKGHVFQDMVYKDSSKN